MTAARPRRHTLLSILMWVCALYFLLPIVWLLISSTKNNADLFSTFGYAFGSHFSLLQNLTKLVSTDQGQFLQWAGNTLVYSGTSALGASLLATMAGYAFAKFRFPGANALFSIILGSVMIPVTALAIPTYLLFSQLQLTDTAAAIIVPSLVSPFGVYLMRIYAADAVPLDMLEAARIDGASELRIFGQVAGRLLAPGFVTVFLFSLVATWNNYFLPLIMLSTSNLYPLTVGLAQLQAESTAGGGATAQFSTVITGSVVSVLPLVVAFLVLQRYWQNGLAAGSVKQ